MLEQELICIIDRSVDRNTPINSAAAAFHPPSTMFARPFFATRYIHSNMFVASIDPAYPIPVL
jgi:hypothetical protein